MHIFVMIQTVKHLIRQQWLHSPHSLHKTVNKINDNEANGIRCVQSVVYASRFVYVCVRAFVYVMMGDKQRQEIKLCALSCTILNWNLDICWQIWGLLICCLFIQRIYTSMAFSSKIALHSKRNKGSFANIYIYGEYGCRCGRTQRRPWYAD